MAELISYLPDVIRDIREFREICKAGDDELAELDIRLADIVSDNFIETLTESGCERWEAVMHISPKATDSLADRRFRILAQLNEQLPYTFRGLLRQLSALCGEQGYTVSIDNDNYTLKVLVALEAKNCFDEVARLLERVVPANLIIQLSLKYNRHEVLAAYTHSELSRLTHEQLRNEVLND